MITCRQAPATCGELMQGAIDGRDFPVNCPIDLYAQATVFPDDGNGLSASDSEHYTKVVEAIALLEVSFKIQPWATDRQKAEETGGKELVVSSCIPRGKGMASNSADLAPALSVVCEIRGLDISPVKMSKLIALVEPSDSVHLPGIAHVNRLLHPRVQQQARLQ